MQELRQLSVIPIVHSEADLGSMAAAVRARFDRAAWDARQRAINAWWDTVADWTCQISGDQTDRPLSDIQIFQDGLPVDAPILPIVRQLAEKGSRNHLLLAELSDLGATIEGTESPELLLKELAMVKATSTGQGADPRTPQRARALLEQRDRFIADRIAATLRRQSRGILLIGIAHNVEAFLPADIAITRPIKPIPQQPQRHAG